MATLDLIFQAVTRTHHADHIRKLLQLDNASSVLLSVAFANCAGLGSIAAGIQPLAARTRCFVGIRNDITSIQAVKELLSLGLELYAVDTGSRQTIFHPKLYLAVNQIRAIAIVGSANMTFGGLHNNIEISTRMELDLRDAADKAYVDSVRAEFDAMLLAHPDHAFKIRNVKHAEQLFDEGRLADEDVIVAPSTGSRIRKGVRDTLPPMKLVRVRPPQRAPKKGGPAQSTTIRSPAMNAGRNAAILAAPSGVKHLVWQSGPLTERDLNIPRGANTNPTGSMGLKKGAYEHIDQRHYFFDQVFRDLAWLPDARTATTLRVTAQFELIVKNVSYGVFDLALSHKTDKSSKTYQQNNFMTQLHWGAAKELIAKQDLLGRTLYLYRSAGTPPQFTIEID